MKPVLMYLTFFQLFDKWLGEEFRFIYCILLSVWTSLLEVAI